MNLVELVPFSEEQQSINRKSLEQEEILSGQFWGELRVFLAVAKAKSFNRAAQILNISQPTVSQQVRRLQDLMGSQLLVPTHKGVTLTPKGEELAAELSKLDHRLFSLTAGLRAEKQATEGIVRMSITDGLNICFVSPHLREFSAQYPKIQCHLKSPLNVMSLHENQTDMMLGFSPVTTADITCVKLGCLHFIAVVSTHYVEEHGLPTRKSLAGHLFLQSEMYAAKTGLWEQWNRLTGMGRIVHYCDNSLAYGLLVKAGNGIGLLGNYTILEPTLMPLDLIKPISVRLYGYALTDRLQARPVRVAFDWMCSIFGADNPWFGEEYRADNPPSKYDQGIKMLFNVS